MSSERIGGYTKKPRHPSPEEELDLRVCNCACCGRELVSVETWTKRGGDIPCGGRGPIYARVNGRPYCSKRCADLPDDTRPGRGRWKPFAEDRRRSGWKELRDLDDLVVSLGGESQVHEPAGGEVE